MQASFFILNLFLEIKLKIISRFRTNKNSSLIAIAPHTNLTKHNGEEKMITIFSSSDHSRQYEMEMKQNIILYVVAL